MKRVVINEEARMWNLRRAVEEMVPEMKGRYGNYTIADAIFNGHKAEMTEDWLRRFLFQMIDDGFITYEEALFLNKKYRKVIDTLN